MTEDFSYKAPQFFDFSQLHDALNDSYFDMDKDEKATTEAFVPPNLYEDITVSDHDSDCFFSPNEERVSNSAIHLKRLRRSLSVGDLLHSPHAEAKYSTSPEDCNRYETPGGPRSLELLKPASPKPARASSVKCLVTKMSQENINRLAQPKRVQSHGDLTLAEAVIKFQAGTPKRFRSKPSPKINKTAVPVPWCATKPQAPTFATDVRIRPVSAISREEQDRRDMEEAKKFKIKANPLNRRVLKGPMKPPVDKKPLTTIQPFHLTEIKKHAVVAEPPKVPVFKAQPLPKSLHSPFKLQAKGQPPTQAHTPNFSKRLSRKTPSKDEKPEPKRNSSLQSVKLTRTQPVPFSFEKRDQLLIKKKEQFINKVLEEEKKAREFHANPLPKAILRSRSNSQEPISEASSSRSLEKNADELDSTTFRARPATVLRMKPFEPKRDENHVVEIAEFQFSTDQRLQARHQFAEKLKEKEALIAAQKREKEEALRKQEEEEVARLRRQMEHKAQPVKKYKEVHIQKANKITQPISPKFHEKIRNKENILQ